MNLDQLNMAIRPRTNAEAIDLGFRLATRHFFACWLPQLFVLLLIAIPCYFIGKSFNPIWMYLVIWWLKPVWEPVTLTVISQAIFSQPPRMKETLSNWLKQPWRQVLINLTWRRLSLARNFDLAVTHLERLSGAQRRQRLNSLHDDSVSSAFALTSFGSVLEAIILAAIIYCTYAVFQFKYVSNSEFLNPYLKALSFFSYTFSISIVAPYFIATGFTLYLNRRTLLEGWDIELQFKRLSNRIKSSTKITLNILFGSIILFALNPSHNSYAADNLNQKQAQQLILESMTGNEFYKQNKAKIVVQRHPEVKSDDSATQQFIRDIVDWIKKHFKPNDNQKDSFGSAAELIRISLWVIAALLVIYLLWRYHDYMPIWRQPAAAKHKSKSKPPEALFGLDLRRATLPEDIPAAATLLWQNGKFRDALSLLYRGALSACVNRFELAFRNYHTEGDCLTIVAVEKSELIEHFSALTRYWQIIAYSHTMPDINFAELCQQWRIHFSAENSHSEERNFSGVQHAKPE